MEIKIKSLQLSNFRGVQEFKLVNLGKETNIFGKNGSGKTSLYDAFIWLLFGKDHEGRSDYELKPRTEKGEQKQRVQVSVTGELIIDGKLLKLERVYREKWVKPRGESEEVFAGNTTEYRINDVEVQMSAYNAKVKELCDETVFKAVTNPHYFPYLTKEEQRKILFSIIPEINDEQIALKKPEFKAILEEVTGSLIETTKKQIAARKRPLKEAIEKIPVEIETTLKNMPAAENWVEVEKELKSKLSELKAIEEQLSDIAKRSQSRSNEILSIQDDINKLDAYNRKLERVEREMAEEDIEREENELRKLLTRIDNIKAYYKTNKARLDTLVSDKQFYTNKLNELREDWKAISAEKIEISDEQFICPTCKRVLESEDIEAKKAELIANFNKQKADRLENNIQQGKKIAEQVKAIEEEIERIDIPAQLDLREMYDEVERFKTEIDALKNKKPSFSTSPVFIANLQKMDELRKSISAIKAEVGADDTELTAKKAEVSAQIDTLKKKLYKKDEIERLKEQVKEMEARKIATNKELTMLEQKEFLIKEFEFAKNAEYEQKINGLFESVQFRLFKQQVDGQIVTDCEAMMNGTLYSTLSNSEKIYAGLDIIRTISKYYDVIAPIFIDNRESTTNIPEMDAQIINLNVNPMYPQLTLK